MATCTLSSVTEAVLLRFSCCILPLLPAACLGRAGWSRGAAWGPYAQLSCQGARMDILQQQRAPATLVSLEYAIRVKSS
jgi:hypothetical protein